MKYIWYLLISTSVFITGCSTMTIDELNNRRNELDTMADNAVKELVTNDPALNVKLGQSLAHGVANMKLTKVPIVGAGGGEGVLLIKKTQERIYFTVRRLDLGGGWGARAYKALIIFNDQKILDQWKDGKWVFEAGAEASAGTAAAQGSSGGTENDFSIHILAEGGASATATARIIRIKVNQALTREGK